MRTVIPVSIALGIGWDVIAVRLMGGKFVDAFSPAWLVSGALAGIAAGLFTIWSRRRREGRESFFYIVATYYLGIFVYWISIIVIERAIWCFQYGGWTDTGLRDHLKMIQIFLVYGTYPFGLMLIPLSLVSRNLLWKIYTRNAA